MSRSKDFGRRLIPTILDDYARDEPGRPLYSIPLTDNVADGFRVVSALQTVNAISRTAWWLEKELGRGTSAEKIGYIGTPHDLRYVLLIIACLKVGYTTVLLSPRNSIMASSAVLESTNCNIWVIPERTPEFLAELLVAHPMKVVKIPTVDELLDPELVPHYQYRRSFDEAKDEPFCILHTSGSTGVPKPIPWKHSLCGTLDAQRLLPEWDGRPPFTAIFQDGDRLHSAFPFAHGAGVIMNILVPAFYGTSNILAPPNAPPNIDLIESLLDHCNIQLWSIIPSIVDDIGETPRVHQKFKATGAKAIIVSGGPVSYGSANKATESVRIVNITGTSEGLFMGSLLTEPEDWIYFAFHPQAGFDFRQIDTGVFEHWVVRKEGSVPLVQGIFHTFPESTEINLKDLYEKHPTKEGLWLYTGRTDDMLVLASAEKIRPVPLEAIVYQHPGVSACIYVGTGKFQPALLVEPVIHPTSSVEKEALIDSIFEKVQEANAVSPPYGRIERDFIMLSDPHKRFVRTDKNTVKRRDTAQMYAGDIDGFYQSVMEDSEGISTEIDVSSIETTLRDIHGMLGVAVPLLRNIESDHDIFSAGVDSLVVFRLTKFLRLALKHYRLEEWNRNITTRFVYANPTVAKLATAFRNLVLHNNPTSGVLPPQEQQIKSMQELRKRYKADLNQDFTHPLGGKIVVLTGSTGSLGSYLLDVLARQRDVERIYCLNRSDDAPTRQLQSAVSRGLCNHWSPGKVHSLKADLSQPLLGLDLREYLDLVQYTTHIIHNQWPVNYNWDLASFEPHIRGVRNLVEFCQRSLQNSSLFYVSTVGTIKHLQGRVAEAPIEVTGDHLGGYASSKLVCELLLQDAVTRTGIEATICRVGKIAGPVLRGKKGQWPKQEWLPTLLTSSKYLGLLPSDLGSLSLVDWIPVDILANIISELSDVSDKSLSNGVNGISNHVKPFQQHRGNIAVFHTVNPHSSQWSELVPSILQHFTSSGKDVRMEVVPYAEWVRALRCSALTMSTENIKENPGVKILDFFEGLLEAAEQGRMWPVPDTIISAAKSTTLKGLEPVKEEWMKLWLGQWGL